MSIVGIELKLERTTGSFAKHDDIGNSITEAFDGHADLRQAVSYVRIGTSESLMVFRARCKRVAQRSAKYIGCSRTDGGLSSRTDSELEMLEML